MTSKYYSGVIRDVHTLKVKCNDVVIDVPHRRISKLPRFEDSPHSHIFIPFDHIILEKMLEWADSGYSQIHDFKCTIDQLREISLLAAHVGIDERSWNTMHLTSASRIGDLEYIKESIKELPTNYNAISAASSHGHQEVVSFLLSHFPNGRRLAALGAIGVDDDMVGMYRDAVEPNRIITDAAMKGCLSLVKLCVEEWGCYKDIDAPIWMAARNGHLEVLVYLVSYFEYTEWKMIIEGAFGIDAYNRAQEVCHQPAILRWCKQYYNLSEDELLLV